MKGKKYILNNSPTMFITCFILSISVFMSKPASIWSAEKISKPTIYSGYTNPEWNGFSRSSTFISADDGTKLAVDVYLPQEYSGSGKAPDKFPVVLHYTPYQRSAIDPETGKVFDPFTKEPLFFRHAFLISYGYAIVKADMRGCGASYGWIHDMTPERLGKDGKTIVDWIAAQPWSNGNVGMEGASYVGVSQILTAAQKPKALKCIMPKVAGKEPWLLYPGGIYSYQFGQYWSAMQYLKQRSIPHPVSAITTPVIDEDGDGEYADEIPLDVNQNGKIFDDYKWPVDPKFPPTYPDGAARENHFFFNAIMEHHAHPDGAPGNTDADSWVKDLHFLDKKRILDGLTSAQLGFDQIPLLMDSGIPSYFYAGWQDYFLGSDIEFFCTTANTNKSRIIIGPTYHSTISKGFADLFGENQAEYEKQINFEYLRWYDNWLKGINNGIDKEWPVVIYVMNGEGWRQEKEWPLKRQLMTKYYFSSGNTLNKESKTLPPGKDEYKADFTHNSGWEPQDGSWVNEVNASIGKDLPVFQQAYNNRQLMFYPLNGLPVRTEMDKKCLTYTSAPVNVNTEVTGYPIVHLWVSSTEDYGDLFFFLEDVNEKGEAILVSEYCLRAGFANLKNDDRRLFNNHIIDIKPNLPSHGFYESDYVDKIFANNSIVKIVQNLYPVSWVFKKGHSIRLSIACANWPTFHLHPKLAPNNKPDDPKNIIPTITVYRDAEHLSHIELPIIPR